jgi:hypothetical protein
MLTQTMTQQRSSGTSRHRCRTSHFFLHSHFFWLLFICLTMSVVLHFSARISVFCIAHGHQSGALDKRSLLRHEFGVYSAASLFQRTYLFSFAVSVQWLTFMFATADSFAARFQPLSSSKRGFIELHLKRPTTRPTSRLSSHTDNYSATQHSAYTSGQGVYTMHSGSSLSLASHALSSSQHSNQRNRELPPLPPSQGYSYTSGLPSTSSRVSRTSYLTHRRA